MTIKPSDLEWLREMRPPAAPAGPEATEARRRGVVGHALRNGRDAATPRRARGHLAGRPLRQAAVATCAAVATFFVVAALWSGGGSGPASSLAPATAAAAPLMKLAAHVSYLPEPGGDATLVLESHQIRGGESFEGANLYLDDGRNFWAPSAQALDTSGAEPKDAGDPYIKAEIDAAAAAAQLSPTVGRERMLAAGPTPGEGAEAKGAADNLLWMRCLDALTFGAGRPEVRAGVLRLLTTIGTVTVAEGEESGRPAVQVGEQVGSEGFVETLTLDADTGIIEKLAGGVPGEAPEVVTTYRTSRVDATRFAQDPR